MSNEASTEPDSFPPLVISLMKFLTVTSCPSEWKQYNLYLFRDEQVVFYAGQSECAFDRVWDHILGGIHGHAIVGRFILVNWPKSMHFSIELHNSRSSRFNRVGHRLDDSERQLIEEYTPCFNVALNSTPHPLPEAYQSPNAPIKYQKSFRRMLREAKMASRFSPQDTEW